MAKGSLDISEIGVEIRRMSRQLSGYAPTSRMFTDKRTGSMATSVAICRHYGYTKHYKLADNWADFIRDKFGMTVEPRSHSTARGRQAAAENAELATVDIEFIDDSTLPTGLTVSSVRTDDKYVYHMLR